MCMMLHMFTFLIPLAALSFAPADTPIVPIPSDIIELGIASGAFDETCDLYAQAIPLVAAAVGDDVPMAMDIVDAYVIWSIEDSWDPAGARFTLEASEAYTTFLHDCIR